MSKRNLDITKELISKDYIFSNLGSVFSDSVFLNLNFEILSISANIQQSLGYVSEEVRGKSVSYLEESGSLEGKIRQQLKAGFFSNVEINLTKKSGEPLRYSISGFYLGLISDLSEIIVLKCTNRQEVTMLDNQLQLSKAQLDNFIYRAAHDIRGPLATIMGLTNLLKMRKNEGEVDQFIGLIDEHAKKLDKRLSHLIYLTDVDDEESDPTFDVDFYDLETHLRKVIEQNTVLGFPEFDFFALTKMLGGVNEVLLEKLLTSLTLYILTLKKSDANNRIIVNCESNSSLLTIRIHVFGFMSDPTIQSGINEGGISMYSDILKNTNHGHIFAAQKVAWKLKASIHIHSVTTEEQYFTLLIPLKNSFTNS